MRRARSARPTDADGDGTPSLPVWCGGPRTTLPVFRTMFPRRAMRLAGWGYYIKNLGGRGALFAAGVSLTSPLRCEVPGKTFGCLSWSVELELVNVANVKISSSNVAVTAPCGGSRPVGRCPCAEGVRLPEREARTPKGPQGAARTRRTK